MRQTRITLLITTTVLLCVGLVMIYSSSAIYAHEVFGNSFYFLQRHLIFLAIGAMLACAVMSFDYQQLKRYVKLIYIASLFVLALVLLPGLGFEAGGARRWLRFGWFGFQPAELAKIGLIVYLADFLSRRQERIKDFFFGFLPPAIAAGLTAGLILAQPDLGNVIVIALVTLTMFFASGVKLVHILNCILLSLPVFYFLVFSVPYRRRRVLAFLNPWLDPKGTGFQMIQSFLALGLGGITGVGLGMSQQKLFYLPASHTDFIFSIIGEELGLLGAVGVTVAFIIFIWQGAKISLKAVDLFGKFLGLGLICKVAFETLINIGVTTGVLPTKGLPLPFISYGGTSLIINMVSVGLLLNIGRRKKVVS